MPLEIHPEDIFFGAPAQLTYGGVAVGATVDKPKASIDVTTFTPVFQGTRGPVKGTTIVSKAILFCEFTVNEFTATKLAWAMPGCEAVTGSADETVGGASTTLSEDAAAGAVTVEVTSTAGISGESVAGAHDGDFIRIGVTGETEIRQVVTVSGTVLVLDLPLFRAHRDLDDVVEVDDRGTTVVTWTPGRVPSSAYQDLVLVGVGLDGAELIVTLFNAMSAENVAMEFGDDSIAGLPVKMTAYYEPMTPTELPGRIEFGASSGS
jgi:hypothetical protein